ncbi:MAG: lamin tail domain-containing protein, partial [Dysgonamonadaceae bacterium]|nr:lamin tail domain-containing protein [Dysgonamonadaceae bacterium]
FSFGNFHVAPLSDIVPPDAGLPAEPGDLVINEILYDPVAESDEYVELYNRSDKQIDLSYLNIAKRNSDGTLQEGKALASGSTILYPGEYLLITGTKDKVCDFYTCYSDIIYCELGSMISLANNGSTIAIFNHWNNTVIDELTYSSNMHTAGLSNAKGISLERIDPDEPTNASSNWSSASGTSGSPGYGTPGYQNSQYKITKENENATGIRIIEPDYSEGNDFFSILYQLSGTDNRCNLKIFDSSGRLVENMLNNSFLGNTGTLKWNPPSHLRPGIYILFMEVYRPSTGEVEKYKVPVILRR